MAGPAVLDGCLAALACWYAVADVPSLLGEDGMATVHTGQGKPASDQLSDSRCFARVLDLLVMASHARDFDKRLLRQVRSIDRSRLAASPSC